MNPRDPKVPLLLSLAERDAITRIYKPRSVQLLTEDASIGRTPCRRDVFILQPPRSVHFTHRYDIMFPVRPASKVSREEDLLQEGVEATTVASKGGRSENLDSTLIMYWTTYWLTESGEVWHEQQENIWRLVEILT